MHSKLLVRLLFGGVLLFCGRGGFAGSSRWEKDIFDLYKAQREAPREDETDRVIAATGKPRVSRQS